MAGLIDPSRPPLSKEASERARKLIERDDPLLKAIGELKLRRQIDDFTTEMAQRDAEVADLVRPLLEDELCIELTDIIRGTLAPATLRAYGADWKAFQEFADKHNATALPASPEFFAFYLLERMEVGGATYGEIRRIHAAISYAHRAKGQFDPAPGPDPEDPTNPDPYDATSRPYPAAVVRLAARLAREDKANARKMREERKQQTEANDASREK